MPSDTPAPSARAPRRPVWSVRLHTRIWLAVVVAFAALLIAVGWAWQLTQAHPLREVLVRDETGEVIGRAERLPPRPTADSPWLPTDESSPSPDDQASDGPEFLVHMDDGQELFIQLPRLPVRSPFGRGPEGFVWLLVVVGLAAALASYPIIKRLTRRLGILQRTVERFGEGNLGARAQLTGDDEVGKLAQRFNWAAARIETLLATHKTLLANASHELRTPLARLRMGLELMRGDPNGTHAADNAAEIQRNIDELDQLIGEILLASRLDAQVADMGTVEQLDLIGLVAEECARSDARLQVASPHATAAQDGELASGFGSVDQPMTVQGVDKLLRRVVRNLLENARRYSPGEPLVTLSIDGRWAVLQVSDRGPGVPADQRERIFEPFYRLPGASESSGGVGLGLALVQSIVARMGGTVRCEDNPGGGARFVVRLPLAADATPR